MSDQSQTIEFQRPTPENLTNPHTGWTPILRNHTFDFNRAASAKAPPTMRDTRDLHNYRAGVVAHEEAILAKLKLTPFQSPEYIELVKDYRFLQLYHHTNFKQRSNPGGYFALKEHLDDITIQRDVPKLNLLSQFIHDRRTFAYIFPKTQ